jgi:hypothetical protein
MVNYAIECEALWEFVTQIFKKRCNNGRQFSYALRSLSRIKVYDMLLKKNSYDMEL